MYERGVLLDGRDHGPDPGEHPSGLVIPHETFELIDHERRNWNRQMREIKATGHPVSMPNQPFRALFPGNNQEPPIVNQTEIASTEEKLLWDPAGAAPQTSIPANTLYADAVLFLEAWGVMTSVAEASKTLTLKPRFGTTVAGTELGTSGAITVTNAAKTSINWNLELVFHVRLIGATGTATCSGVWSCLTVPAPINFGTTGGTTATTINTTTASGLLVTATNSVATNKQTCMGVVMESLN